MIELALVIESDLLGFGVGEPTQVLKDTKEATLGSMIVLRMPFTTCCTHAGRLFGLWKLKRLQHAGLISRAWKSPPETSLADAPQIVATAFVPRILAIFVGVFLSFRCYV